jgi:hypothetical protein
MKLGQFCKAMKIMDHDQELMYKITEMKVLFCHAACNQSAQPQSLLSTVSMQGDTLFTNYTCSRATSVLHPSRFPVALLTIVPALLRKSLPQLQSGRSPLHHLSPFLPCRALHSGLSQKFDPLHDHYVGQLTRTVPIEWY